MEYPKIHSLWMRHSLLSGKTKRPFIVGEYAKEEFGSISKWRVEEKIDGMNIRLYIDRDRIDVKGRTNYSKIPGSFMDYINNHEFRSKVSMIPFPGILFGEGFGAGIQTGGIYRPTQAFMLFDAYIDRQWLSREGVRRLGETLGFDTPHDFGIMTEDDIIDLVKSAPRTYYEDKTDIQPKKMLYQSKNAFEGVMVRSEPQMRFNDQQATPIMWKLKVKDFYE